ncbi:MAG: 50S ribosomal protein L4 [Candidatus Lokiarchaeota archaeon]|nr:50S ribosomal protein L4 [Candidatus Harpocratesius repetitus]
MATKSKSVKILGLDGTEKGNIELPDVFNLFPRFDLIQRAVVASESAQKQPQGRDPLAGKRNTAESWGTGYASARVPRLTGSGYPSSRNAAFAPGVVGGRLAHPPRAEKVIAKRINKKEKILSLLSAISATGRIDLIKNRGHKINDEMEFPLVVDDKLQTLKKTTQVIEVFDNLGLIPEIDRVKEGRQIRAGKGKRRGRKYRKKVGPLIVIKDDFGIFKAARNIPGVDVVNIKNLSCKNLAPGTHPGRLVIWTQSAFQNLKKFEVN